MANEKRLTWKRSLAGFEDVGLRDGVTVGEAICKLADLEERETVEVIHAKWTNVQGGKGCCSNCNRLDSVDNLATHCRYCGAKMDGGNEDG